MSRDVPSSLTDLARETFGLVSRALDDQVDGLRVEESGTVVQVTGATAQVEGLAGVRADEVVRFEGGLLGLASNLEPGGVGVVLLGSAPTPAAGSSVRRTGRVVDVPVGPALVGRVVDPLGRPLDGGGPIRAAERWPTERGAPDILDRAPVSVPLETGIKAIDALVPIGRGQRQLVLGDRQTGKTAIAVDTITNQRGRGVVSVYCAIGQRGSAVAGVIAALRAHGAMDHSIVVVAGGEEPPGLKFLAPYAATSMAEYFVARGRDVLVVYDDLTRHARAYRELSLLLRRPPGREAYPGDIFYVHARLLERATRLRESRGGGSLTALPIVETQAQNLSAYIPTNLISITDGQVYLSPDLFRKGLLPAVDVGRSVSRVGGRAQLPAFRAVAGPLRLAYAQFEELEAFSRFGTRLDERTRRDLERGRRVREVLKQPQYRPLPVADQVAVLFAAGQGVFDAIEPERVAAAEAAIRRRLGDQAGDVVEAIERGERLGDEARHRLLELARAAVREILPAGGARGGHGDA
ncbi:MAG TPA: alternate F1F0 ATPase, F1 subunit alpha [Thermodesulfobacteriota bacterium]